MDRDPFTGQRSGSGQDTIYWQSEFRRIAQRLSDVKDERDKYERLYYKQAGRLPNSIVFFFTAFLFCVLAAFSHAIRSDLEADTKKASSELARAEYLKTILPLSPSIGDVASQCDAGKARVGYTNGTGRALALVDFEVRGYLPHRVSNIVETKEIYVGKDKPNVNAPDARLDRIVQPGDSFNECVKLNIEHAFQDHPELGKATYKVRPIGYKFLEDYPGYVQDHTKN